MTNPHGQTAWTRLTHLTPLHPLRFTDSSVISDKLVEALLSTVHGDCWCVTEILTCVWLSFRSWSTSNIFSSTDIKTHSQGGKKKKNRNIRVFAHQHESSLEGRGRRSRGPLFQVRSANREEQERRESNYIHHRPTILVLVINLNLSWEDGYAFSQDDFKAKRNPRQEL